MKLKHFLAPFVVWACVLMIWTLFLFLAIRGPSYMPSAEAAGNRYSLNTKTVAGDEVVISDYIITDLSSATLLTVPVNARAVMIQAQIGNIRFRWGTAPTATTGGIIYAGDYLETASSIDTIQLIQESSANAYVAFKR